MFCTQTLALRYSNMKKPLISMAVVATLLSGCADMTRRQKYWTAVAVSAVAVGAYAAYRHQHKAPAAYDQFLSCYPVTMKGSTIIGCEPD